MVNKPPKSKQPKLVTNPKQNQNPQNQTITQIKPK